MNWKELITKADIYTYEYFAQDNICRLCWNKNACTEIRQKVENTQCVSFVEIINYCLDIELNGNNPNKLCESCCKELNSFYFYKKICTETNEKLQEILQRGPSEVKNEEPHTVTASVKEENSDKIDEFTDNYLELDIIDEKKCKKSLKPKHIDKDKDSSTYCNTCCINLDNKDNFVKHNVESHGIENDGTLFKCFGCEKRFKTRRNRMCHELNFCKHLKDGFKCNICNRFLPKRRMFEHHMRDHKHNATAELPEQIFKCGKCLKLFESKKLLRVHMVEHAQKFVCDICGRMFSRQDYLHKHKLTHTGTKRHQCPHCDFRAIQKSSLTCHIRKHTGERPYVCDVCPQRCISSSNLRAHQRRHRGLKNYECTICSKKYGSKTSLEEHISATHLQTEPHSCEHCGATYMRRRGLKRHLATKHGKQNKTEENILVQVVNESESKVHVLKDVGFDLEDSDSVLLVKHQGGNDFMV